MTVFKTTVLVGLIVSTGCAGYQVGNYSLYPADVHTVYVPVFDSTSFRSNLGERLTEAVIKEIELKTPYKVVGTPDADSILTGRLVKETKRLTVETPWDDPRQYNLDLQVEVSWIDRRGNIIRQADSVPLPPEAIIVSGDAGLVPEVGQSVATSHQQAIGRVAEQIVSMMEMPW